MPKSVQRWVTILSNSSKVPSSSRNSIRSRADILPSLCWRVRRSSPPPASASVSRRFSSASFCSRSMAGIIAAWPRLHRSATEPQPKTSTPKGTKVSQRTQIDDILLKLPRTPPVLSLLLHFATPLLQSVNVSPCLNLGCSPPLPAPVYPGALSLHQRQKNWLWLRRAVLKVFVRGSALPSILH